MNLQYENAWLHINQDPEKSENRKKITLLSTDSIITGILLQYEYLTPLKGK